MVYLYIFRFFKRIGMFYTLYTVYAVYMHQTYTFSIPMVCLSLFCPMLSKQVTNSLVILSATLSNTTTVTLLPTFQNQQANKKQLRPSHLYGIGSFKFKTNLPSTPVLPGLCLQKNIFDYFF